MEPINSERTPVVFEKDGEIFANTRDVAAFFGKEHRVVLAAVDKLILSDAELGLHNFVQTPYVEAQNGQTYRSFNMDRDGFSLLAMGFNGSKALKWKRRFLEAFNAMEADLRERAKSGPMIDVNDPAQLRGLLLSYTERSEELTRQVEQLTVSKDALDRIAEADGSLCITDAAKALQMRPKVLFGWLRANGWIYRRHGTNWDVGYQSKVGQGLLEHKVTTITRPDGTERITEQVRVSPKGLAKLAELMKDSMAA